MARTLPTVFLASQSPRRAQLLSQLGLRFEVVVAPADESPHVGEAADVYVQRVARAKIAAARAKYASRDMEPLLAADTAVELDGRILGKPRDRAEGMEMLAVLSSREHRVFSGLALRSAGALHTALSVSRVRFRAITSDEAAAYWQTGEPADKAGGYAIQGRGAVFVEQLIGSYSGVMGLPLFETAKLLREAGFKIL